MKKIIFSLVIIIAAIIVIANIIPAAAKSTAPSLQFKKNFAVKPVKRITPPPVKTASSTPVETSTPPLAAKPKPAAKTAPVKTAVVPKATVRWASSGLKAIGSLASFDYSTKIRNAYMRKVEAYAKSKNIKLITAAVVNSMHQ